MRRLNTLIWPLAMAMTIVLLACDREDEDGMMNVDNLIIVEGYVYANEPIEHLRLSKIHSGGSAIDLPVHDASVWIEQEGYVYEMSASDTLPGLYMQSDTSVIPLDYGDLHLNIEYGGRTYKAITSMPPLLTGLEISSADIHIQPGNDNAVLAHLSWDAVSQGPYCLFIRNITENAVLTGHGGAGQPENPFFKVVYQNSIDLKGAHFSHYGTYEIYVTAVNKEYTDLYNSNPALSMVSAPTNIQNGFGVFTAFNGQSVTVHVQ